MEFILERPHRNVSDAELLSDLRSVSEQLKKSAVTIEDYNSIGRYHACTFTRRFGSWFAALEKCGLQKTRSEINIPEEDLFDNIENLWRHFGRQPRYHEVVKPLSRYSNSTYANRFGSFYKALEAFVASVNGSIVDKHPVKGSHSPRAINYRIRFCVLQRDGFKCCACGASPAKDPNVNLHIDHIIPVSKGGTSDISNLQTLCERCNLGKSNVL